MRTTKLTKLMASLVITLSLCAQADTGDNTVKDTKIVQTAGRDNLGDFAPEFARLNDDVLFGEEWNRQDKLSLRDRSVVTVMSLIGSGVIDSSLKYHIENAKKNGVSKEEMAEILTHASFYVGWPKTWAAMRMAKEVYQGEPSKDEKTLAQEQFDKENVFGKGKLNEAYAKYFIGNSYLNPALTDPNSDVKIFNVTFEPGCRNNWHIHHATKGGGQILIVTAGEGWYVEEGKEPRSLKPGDTVFIKANVKHWHGAKKDKWFSHLAFEVPGEGLSNEWLEPVSDKEYNAL